jgi:hypothetical protein
MRPSPGIGDFKVAVRRGHDSYGAASSSVRIPRAGVYFVVVHGVLDWRREETRPIPSSLLLSLCKIP